MRSMVEGAATNSMLTHPGDQMFHGLTPANTGVSRTISPTYPHTSEQWYSPPAVAKPRVTDEVAATETGVGWSHSARASLG